jgi:hypothetical protein
MNPLPTPRFAAFALGFAGLVLAVSAAAAGDAAAGFALAPLGAQAARGFRPAPGPGR